MSTTRTVGIGLVGCGTIGPLHARAVAGIEGARLVAVADLRRERSEKLAAEHGVTACSSMDELLGTPGVDLVSICTPSGTHGELGAQAARAGRHVVVEKPVDTTMQAARDLVEACHKAGVVLSVISQHRFDPGTQRLKATLDAGGLGRVLLAEGRVWWYRSQGYYDAGSWRGTYAQDGGALMNQASHYVDLLDWLIGPIESLHAYTATLARDIEVEDTAVMNLKWRSGALGSMNVTMLTYPKNLEGSITLLGEKGSVRIGGVAVNEIQHWEFAESHPDDDRIKDANYQTTSVYGFGHPLYYDNVLQVLRGEAEPETDGREGLKSLEVLIAAYISARDGRRVSLPLDY